MPLRTIPNIYAPFVMRPSIRSGVSAMMSAKNAHEVARHVEELAQDCVLPDYIRKLAKAARDLEQWACELEGKTQPEAH